MSDSNSEMSSGSIHLRRRTDFQKSNRILATETIRVWAAAWPTVSEMAFLEGAMMVFQLQLTKRQDVVPMTRDYIVREEARLRALEGGGRLPLRLAGE